MGPEKNLRLRRGGEVIINGGLKPSVIVH